MTLAFASPLRPKHTVRLRPCVIYGVALFMRATSGESGTEGPEPSFGALRVLRSKPAIILEAAWLYMFAWAVFFGVAALRPDAGRWEFEEWVLTGALLVPIVLIPAYLRYCVRRRSLPKFRHCIPWIVRVMYVSIILAMCDSWAAGTERRAPLFSRVTWAMSDGGTRGSVGFGYSLTYHRTMGGEHGPEVWFWFMPFTVRWTSEHVGLRCLWQAS